MEALQTSNASVIQGADGATKTQPRTTRNAILGLMLGALLGLGLAFLAEALDTRVRSADDVADRLNIPLLARIPAPPRSLRSADRLVMVAQPRSEKAEPFRVLRTNLEYVGLEKKPKTIMVTSALEGEGKSTTAANLAVALAMAGHHVVLVDLDLRRPYLDRFFGMRNSPTLIDVALGRISVEHALVPFAFGGSSSPASSTNGANENGRSNGSSKTTGLLEVLAAGRVPPNPGEFTGSPVMSGILSTLAKRASFVVIDTAPLLGVGDTLALSKFVDGIVLVARLKRLRKHVLAEVDRLLDSTPADVLGFVVTDSEAEEHYGRLLRLRIRAHARARPPGRGGDGRPGVHRRVRTGSCASTPACRARSTTPTRLSEQVGARILLKREDLNHTGAHKIRNVLGQALLTKRMGKTRVIAETGAGQHGVATRHRGGVLRPRLHRLHGRGRHRAAGAQRRPDAAARRRGGPGRRPAARTLKDAINEALRDWVASVDHTAYLLRHGRRPAPVPGDGPRLLPRHRRRGARAVPRAAPARCPTPSPPASAAAPTRSGCSPAFLDDADVAIYRLRGRRRRRRHRAARRDHLRRRGRRAARRPHLRAPGRGRPDRRVALDLGRASTTRASARSTPTSPRPAGRRTARSPTPRRWTRWRCSPAPRASSRPSSPRTRSPARCELAKERPGPTILVNLSGRGDKDMGTAIDWFGLGQADADGRPSRRPRSRSPRAPVTVAEPPSRRRGPRAAPRWSATCRPASPTSPGGDRGAARRWSTPAAT